MAQRRLPNGLIFVGALGSFLPQVTMWLLGEWFARLLEKDPDVIRRQIQSDTFVDVIRVRGGQSIGIDVIRRLQQQTQFGAHVSQHTVIVFESADQLSISYYRSFSLPVKIIRPFNTYGPRQSARAIIPTIITQCLSGKKYIEIGNLSPRRDFTHVADTCNSFLSVYRSSKLLGKVVNIGMNNEISIKELSDKIIYLTGSKAKIKQIKKRFRPSNSEVNILRCDNNMLLKYTSWKPKYNFDSGIKNTIKWFKESKNFYSTDKYYV